MHRDTTFQIKTYNDYHSCKGWNHRNNTITSSYIARRYLDDISRHRDWNVKEFRDHVSIELRAHVTLHQCRRAKQKALKIIDGDLNAQYKVMWNYCNEIGRTNPNTSIHMKLLENEVPNKPNRFQRIYICFGGCKEGFKSVCRRIVGVDAYAVVEKERMESWAWFLNYLKCDLEIDDDYTWTFMSDKQKGLIEAFNEVLPFVSHRFCVRNLHNNFKRAGFSGISLKNALWKAARASTEKWFNTCMVEIFYLDSEVANWFRDKLPSEWSRSHFSENAKSNILLNNMCENFNGMILEARDKPIITLLKNIRYLLMARMQANRDKAARWDIGDICLRIKDILHKNQAGAAEFIPRKSNEWNYEIIGASIHDKWDVDLLNKICSCRKWDLTGIPCKHAIAAIWAKKMRLIPMFMIATRWKHIEGSMTLLFFL
ncbi:uncharacterized protein LOC142162339 [Nicotiana tabacum]|uniref:Uncharacterized protein LOC142162339 n=1 Tax=Nicotiana tabacum TaxID=4097 RepID=A0AC58RQ42_TOBAC